MKEKEQILIEYSDRENLLKAENEKLANKLKVYEAFGDKVSLEYSKLIRYQIIELNSS